MRVTPDCDSIKSFTICAAANIQMFPDIAYGNNCNLHLVAWSDGRLGASQDNIYAARINPSGTVLDAAGILIGPPTVNYQYGPSVAYNGSEFFVAWGTYDAAGGIFGRFVKSDGSLGDTIRLATGYYPYGTELVYNGSNFMLIWNEYMALKGIVLSSAGLPVTAPFEIAPYIEYYNGFNLCWDGNTFFVVYADATPSGTHQIWGRKYDTAGTPVGAAIPVSNSSNLCYYPAVAAGDNNRYLNLWDEEYGMFNKIYGNVDISIIAVAEAGSAVPGDRTLPTILRPSTAVKALAHGTLYDATGRAVKAAGLSPGVYFFAPPGLKGRKILIVE